MSPRRSSSSAARTAPSAKRLPQPKDFLCYAFAPDGKSAAVCLARDKEVAVTVYDPSGTPAVEAAIERKAEGAPSALMWLSNRREVLVHVMDMPVEAVLPRQASPVEPGWRPTPPKNPQTYFIQPDGAVVALGDLSPSEACFPPGAPGVAILSPQGWDPGEPAPRFVLIPLGGDLETLWRHEVPAGAGYVHLCWHAQGGLPPLADFALDVPGQWWDFRADGQAARRPRSQTAWCAATREVGHPALDGRTVKLAIHTQMGSPLRAIGIADVSTDWFEAAACGPTGRTPSSRTRRKPSSSAPGTPSASGGTGGGPLLPGAAPGTERQSRSCTRGALRGGAVDTPSARG
jgi:hypothetical protein